MYDSLIMTAGRQMVAQTYEDWCETTDWSGEGWQAEEACDVWEKGEPWHRLHNPYNRPRPSY